MTWEHKVNKSFYYGATFRAVTNSYRLASNRQGLQSNGKNYIRIDDNQLAFFADVYLTTNIALNAEIGHSVLRKIQTGYRAKNASHHLSIYERDNVFVKAALAFRIRFKQK